MSKAKKNLPKLAKRHIEEAKLKPRQFGLWKGKVRIHDNFNDEDEEINKLFYGEE